MFLNYLNKVKKIMFLQPIIIIKLKINNKFKIKIQINQKINYNNLNKNK